MFKKVLIFISVMFVSINSSAEVKKICQRMEVEALDLFNIGVRSYEPRFCWETVRYGKFQDDAVKICEPMIDGEDTLGCLDTIKNEKFTAESIKKCDSYEDNWSKIYCLEEKAISNYNRCPTMTEIKLSLNSGSSVSNLRRAINLCED